LWTEPKLFFHQYEYRFVALNKLRGLLSSTAGKGAFYTISYGRFVNQWGLWRQQLPHVQPYYAVKCNPDAVLLKWLSQRGAAFDCASSREMMMVSGISGVDTGSDILFANPCKTPQDIEVAKLHKVKRVTVDSIEELVKMDKANYRPEVVLRLAVDDAGSSCPFSAKFGCSVSDAAGIACAAKVFDMPVIGLSFHIGSGNERPNAFRYAVEQCGQVWNESQLKGFVGDLQVLDLGGGWSHHEKLFKEQAAAARKGLAYVRAKENIAEPGRFFAAPVYDLYVRVIGKKPRAGGGWRYTIDESVYGQFSCIPFDHATPRVARLCVGSDTQPRKKTPASVFGRTCDSLDWIANGELEELDVGDWLYFPEMGAYTAATSTEFNGFPKPDCIETSETPVEGSLQWQTLRYPLAEQLSLSKLAELS
jgi:ornithine decarboxylase